MTTSRHAFTLTELLVALAIMGVLAAIVVPVVNVARNAALLTACQSNVRQIGIAQLAYANDWRGRLPGDRTRGFDPRNCWMQQIRPYVQDADENPYTPIKFMSDPALTKISPITASEFTNYAMNLNIACTWAPDEYGSAYWTMDHKSMNRISTAEGTMLAMGGMRANVRVFHDWHVKTASAQSSLIMPHRGRTDSVVYVDGHVGAMKFARFPLEETDDFWSVDQ